MTAKHTPWPWRVYDPEKKGATYGITGGDGTAVVFWGETSDDGINKIGDARLIAAAPDLLEACRRLLVCMSLAGWECDPTAEYARTVIASATKGAKS